MAIEDRRTLYATDTVSGKLEKDHLASSLPTYTPLINKTFRVPEWCVGRIDLISYLMYGKSDLWWLICQANGILDPWDEIVFDITLNIPNISDYYSFQDEHSRV